MKAHVLIRFLAVVALLASLGMAFLMFIGVEYLGEMEFKSRGEVEEAELTADPELLRRIVSRSYEMARESRDGLVRMSADLAWIFVGLVVVHVLILWASLKL